MTDPILIGCAAGFSGDRIDVVEPVVDALVASGRPAALIFETLAERTLALAQLARRNDPEAGYEPALADYLRPVIAKCLDHKIRIIGNVGQANPEAAARLVHRLAQEAGRTARIAIVEGDDILASLGADEVRGMTVDPPLGSDIPLVAANAYLGAREIAGALAAGADIVITGRVSDPSLTLGPVMNHFGWNWEDWDRLASGTLAGHLLECGSQITGGYYADPGFKDVPGLASVGFPIAEISEDGGIVVTKPDGTGGLVSRGTVMEQLLYEIHDPSSYLTPDVVLDVTRVEIEEVGKDRVAVRGAKGRERPPTLKATVSIDGGYVGEAEISYAGPNASKRARLAAEIIRERLSAQQNACRQRYDLIGMASLFNDDRGSRVDRVLPEVEDVRFRLAVSSDDRALVERATREVLSLYCDGPAGGGGVRRSLTPIIHTASAFVPRERVPAQFRFVEARNG